MKKTGKTAEIIRPILRGRDIKRYGYEFAELYIITTFPSLKIDIELYPSVKQHLLSFGLNRLKQTGEPGARKKTSNKWFETQDSISYWDDFFKQKIVYPDIMRMPRQEKLLSEYPYFYLDQNNYYIEATNFMMTGSDIDLIYLFVTSDLGFFVFSKFYSGPQFDATGFRYKKAYLDEMVIPKIPDRQAERLRTLLENKDLSSVNETINTIWAEIAELTVDEAQFVANYKMSLLMNSIDSNEIAA